jgi:hypothetical protein
VEGLEELDRYPWSGHAVLLGNGKMEGQVVEGVLGYFGKGASKARKRYREFIADGISMGRRKEFSSGGLKRSRSLAENGRGYEAFDSRVLGGSEFVQDLWRKEELKDKIKRSLSLMELVEGVAHFFDIHPDEIRRPRKEWFLAQVRGVVCYLAVRELGYRGVETGKELRLGPAGVSIAVRRGEAYLKEKPGLKEKLTSAINK